MNINLLVEKPIATSTKEVNHLYYTILKKTSNLKPLDVWVEVDIKGSNEAPPKMGVNFLVFEP